jgi:hypothetical protein
MARGMNWDKVNRQEMVRSRGSIRGAESRALAKHMPKGITNPQAKLLADLQRQLGEPYSGSGMTCAEASGLIDDCFRRLGRKRAA